MRATVRYPDQRDRATLRRMSTPQRIVLAGAAVALIAGLAVFAYIATSRGLDTTTTPPASTTPAGQGAVGSAPAPRLRVADLMAQAGCRGDVIGTQLHSYETGRCQHPAGGEMTIAVFDSNDLRDQWLAVAQGFGGSFVIGEGWAAMLEQPDAAEQTATALGGHTT